LKNVSVLLLIIFVILLNGSTNGINTNYELMIKSIINSYFSALDKQNWSKAKGYCTYGSEMYNDTVQLENTINNYCFSHNDCRVVL
jgi:hypothetical protein